VEPTVAALAAQLESTGYQLICPNLFCSDSTAVLQKVCKIDTNTSQISLLSAHIENSSKPGVPNLPLTMYRFSISADEHVPLKFLMTKYFIMINHKYI